MKNPIQEQVSSNTTRPACTGVLALLILLLLPRVFFAQEYDLVIKGGHVIDPKNNLNRVVDVAISGDSIARVAANIPDGTAKKVIDARGLYVTPGLIDIHAHVYYGVDPESEYNNGFNGIKPDDHTFRSGVTTVVDAGSSGWRNFDHFKDQVIDRAETRVLAFVNIVGYGMKGSPWEQDLNDMDPKLAALAARGHRRDIVGVKLAHYNGHEWEQVDRLVKAGELADVPVMVDFGGANPPLPLEKLFMEKLRPGDIYTHVFGGGGRGRQAIVDENSKLRPFIFDAQKRGIILDVGHGNTSFSLRNAVPAMKAGFKPNTISTDGHGRSILSGMKDMTNVMSKLLNLGMTLEEVITASTWKPASVIKREELGHLTEGAVADVTILNVRTGKFGFLERSGGEKMEGDRKIEAEMTIRGGRIVWDLNGLSASVYKQP